MFSCTPEEIVGFPFGWTFAIFIELAIKESTEE